MPQKWSLAFMIPLLAVALPASGTVGPGGACSAPGDCLPYSDCVNGFCCGNSTTYGDLTNCTKVGAGSGGNTHDCCANNSAALACTTIHGQDMCCLTHGTPNCKVDSDCCDDYYGDRCFGTTTLSCATCSTDQTAPQGTTGNWNSHSCCSNFFVTKDGGSPATCCSPTGWKCSTDYDCCANAGISDAGALPVVCGAAGDKLQGECCIPVGSSTDCSTHPYSCCSGSCDPLTNLCDCQ